MDPNLPKIDSFDKFKDTYPSIWYFSLNLPELYVPSSFWVAVSADGLINGHNAVNEENWWHCREARRFFDGQYRAPYFLHALHKLPYKIRSRYNHQFLHMSTDFPEMVSFTPSAEYGKADRQVVMKVGRYLTKFYADALTAEQIREIANNGKDLDIQWAYGFDIVDIYLTGPESCMSHQVEDYATDGIHPTEVYGYKYPERFVDGVRTADSGAHEFGLAYLTRADKIIARSLVAVRHNVFARCYGDEGSTLESKLVAAGFAYASSMGNYGLRLKKMTNDCGDIVCPYLDGGDQDVDDYGTHLVWVCDGNGEYSADNTGGTANEKKSDCYCGNCDNSVDNDSMHYIEGEEISVCEDCYRDYFVNAFYGYHNNTRVMRRDQCVMAGDYWYANNESVLDHHGIVECVDGEYRDIDDCVRGVNGEWYEHEDDLFILCSDDSMDERYAPRDKITNAWRGRWNCTSTQNEFAGEFIWLHPNYLPDDITLVRTIVDDFGRLLKFSEPNPEYMSPGQAAYEANRYDYIESIDGLCDHIADLCSEYECSQILVTNRQLEQKAWMTEPIDLTALSELCIPSSDWWHEENRV